MSRQRTTQASGQGMLGRAFKLCEYGTTARTEVITGFTTFLTAVCVVFVNPQVPGVVGMDTSVIFVTTYLIAVLGSIMMGLFANLLVALAPAMDLNALFSFVAVQAMGLPWQVGMGAIFWGAIGLPLLTIFRAHYWMIANISVSLRVGVTNGIGLFIGMTGLKNAGVIIANPETLMSIGNLTSHSVLLGILGFFIIAILVSHNIHAAVLASIVVTMLLGWVLGDVHYNGTVSAPPSVMSVVGHVDLAGSFSLGLAGVIFSFMLVNLLDSSGMLIGVTDKAGLADEKGKFPRMKQALHVDSISSVTGSFIGTSSATAHIEFSSGVSIGGRTDLTAVIVGLPSLLAILLPPLTGTVPGCAAAGALTYVGALMISNLTRMNWQDSTESAPALITTVVMPLSFPITEGIALGFISYCMMKIGIGHLRDFSPCVIVVALLSIPKIVFIDAY